MKKLLFVVLAATSLTFIGCKKSGSGGGVDEGEFKIGSSTYQTTTVQVNSGALIAAGISGTSAGGLAIGFYNGTAPTANGVFTIVETPGAANEVSVKATRGLGGPTSEIFESYVNADNPTATVTITGGKLNVKFSSLNCKDSNGNEVSVSANVTQD